MERKFDAVIIGSGAGGAPIAHALTLRGKSVLVLEKGPLFLPQYQAEDGISDFKRDELLGTGAEKRITLDGVENRGQSYYSSHVEPDLNDEAHVYRGADGKDRATLEGYTAQVVGGGTNLFGAVSLRYPPDDFRLRSLNEGRTDLVSDPGDEVRREARDWPIGYQELEPYYCKAERLIGINGTHENQAKKFGEKHYQKPLEPNPISDYVARGMDFLGMKRYRTPLAVITEDHPPSGRKAPPDRERIKTGFVNRYGDPLGFKSSTWVSLLSPIKNRPNFEIRPNCVVTHLECQGSRVTKVHYRDPSGRPEWVEGRIVAVACSAIESVRLLMLSAEESLDFALGLNPVRDFLGKYFLTHCFGGAEVVVPLRFDKSISLDSDWATDHGCQKTFLQEHGLWAGGAIYNNTSDQALPISAARTHASQDLDTIWRAFIEDASLTGESMVRFLDETIGKRLSVSFMANQVPMRDNRIELHPKVRDKWGRKCAYIIKDWHAHDKAVMDVLAEQCARILSFGCDGGLGRYPVTDKGGVYMADNAPARIANHILGGARFGSDPKDSVLDPDCRVWSFDNLYVTDGAFMPTSGGANPTLTIEANAFRVADILAGRI